MAGIFDLDVERMLYGRTSDSKPTGFAGIERGKYQEDGHSNVYKTGWEERHDGFTIRKDVYIEHDEELVSKVRDVYKQEDPPYGDVVYFGEEVYNTMEKKVKRRTHITRIEPSGTPIGGEDAVTPVTIYTQVDVATEATEEKTTTWYEYDEDEKIRMGREKMRPMY